jgi:glycosyltransferase involved in cell wall biosynthesis
MSLPRGMIVVVVDAQSYDRTRELAVGNGALVIERPWTDFVDARRFALAQVRTQWALMLDADEALDDRLRDAIANAAGDARCYTVARTTYFCGRAMRLWREERLVRIFRPKSVRLEAHPAAGGSAALHERWVCADPAGALDGELLHFSYPDRRAYREKFARYTALEAHGLRFSILRLLTACVAAGARFLWMLFGRGAVRDGWRGAYIAWWSALYPAAVAWQAGRAA